MTKRISVISFATALAVSLVVVSAGPATAGLDKCQKSVSKEIGKLESKMLKALNKCADQYAKAVRKGNPISSIAGKCNDALSKTFDITNPKSKIAKAKDKLASLIPKGKCTDEDLSNLGHLTENVWGDKWQRWALIAAWKSAYENALSANANLVDIFEQTLATGSCGLCSLVSSPPCHAHNCILGAGSGGPVNTRVASPLVTTNLTGAVPIASCNVPSVFPAGEIAIVGTPNRGIARIVDLLPGVHVCVTSFRAEGYINCLGAAGNPRVDTDICVDHLVQDLGGGVFADECETGAPTEVCQPDAADTDHALAPGEVNGGTCLNVTTNAATAGDAFFLATTRIQIVLAAEVGGDGEPCTFDDVPATVTAPATIPQTTGQAMARVIDPDAMDAAPDLIAGPVSGVAAPDCDVLQSSDSSGLETVSAAAALHGLEVAGTPYDTAFITRLVCQ